MFSDEPDAKSIAVASSRTQLLAWLDLFLETRWQTLDADRLFARCRDALGSPGDR